MTRNIETNGRKRVAAVLQCALIVLNGLYVPSYGAASCKVRPLPEKEKSEETGSLSTDQFSDLGVNALDRYISRSPYEDLWTGMPEVELKIVSEEDQTSPSERFTLTVPNNAQKKPDTPVEKPGAQEKNTACSVDSPNNQSIANILIQNKQLEVTKTFPVGEISLYKQISISFSKPMVGQTSILKPLQNQRIVSIWPYVDGDWLWANDRTLICKPRSKFFPSNLYTIKVNAGVTAHDGSKLAEPFAWTFATGRIQPSNCTGDRVGTGQFIPMMFNFPPNKQSVLAKTKLIADGKNIPLVFYSDAEVAKVYGKSPAIGSTTFELRPTDLDALKKSKKAKVVIESGILPLHGNRLSTHKIEYPVKWAPMAVVSGSLITRAFNSLPVEPLEPWSFAFNQAIDIETVTPERLEVKPPISDMNVYVKDNWLYVTGKTQPNTNYSLTLKAGISGQKGLESAGGKPLQITQDTVLTIPVKSAFPRFVKPDFCVRLDPEGSTLFPIHSVNIRRAEVAIYSTDEKLSAQSIYGNGLTSRTPLHKETLELNFKPDECVETTFDLKPYLEKSKQLLVTVTKADPPAKEFEGKIYIYSRYQQPNEYSCWVQSTNLNLTAVTSHKGLFCLVTDRKTGLPVENASVETIDGQARFPQPPSPVKLSGKTNKSGFCEFRNFPSSFSITGVTASTQNEKVSLVVAPTLNLNSGVVDSKLGPFAWTVNFDNSSVKRESKTSFFGWVREAAEPSLATKRWSPKLVGDATVTYEVVDSQNQTIDSGSAKLTANGGFAGTFTVPQNTSCGVCWLNVRLMKDGKQVSEQEHSAAFEIAEAKETPAISMDLKKQNIRYVKPGETVRTVLKMKTQEGAPVAGKEIVWTSSLQQRNWTPPGWSQLSFGRNLSSSGSNKSELSKKTQQLNSVQTKTDESGQSALLTTFKADFTTPAVLNVQTTDGKTNAIQLTHYEVLPADFLVGIANRIQRSFDKQSVFIDFLVCDQNGTPVAGRPVNITIKNSKTGQELFNTTATSTTSLQTIKAELNGLDQLDLIAEVSDQLGRVHRANALTKPERDTIVNKAERKVRLDLEFEGPNPTNTNSAIVDSPFPSSHGFFVSNSSEETDFHTVETNGTPVSLPFKPSMEPNGTEILAKVYEHKLNQDGKALSAVGVIKAQGRSFARLPVYLEALTSAPQAGSSVDVKIQVKNLDGTPCSRADIVVTGAEEISLAGTNSDFFNVLSSGLTFFDQVTPVSTDRVNAPMTVLEANTKRLRELSKMGPEKHCVLNSYSVPEPIIEDVQTFFSSIQTTDDAGCTTVKVPLPVNSKNYKISAYAVSGDDRFGQTSLIVSAAQPLQMGVLKPEFVYGGDNFSIPIKISNSSQVEKNLSVAVKNGTEQNFSTLGEVKVGPTKDSVVQIAGAEKLAEKFAIEVKAESLNSDFAFDVKRFDKPQHVRVELPQTKSVLEALDDVGTFMQSKTCNSTDQLASRLITLLALKDIKGEKDFSGCCDDVAREDLCQLAKMINAGILRWINQTDAYNLNYPSPLAYILTANALAMANDAGLTLENGIVNTVTERMEYLECPEKTSPTTKFRVQALGNLSWAMLVKANRSNYYEEEDRKSQLRGIAALTEKSLQGRKIQTLDAQTASAFALLSQRVVIYPGLQKELKTRLSDLLSANPELRKAQPGDTEVLLDSDTMQTAWLLEACCRLDIGTKEQRRELAAQLLRSITNHGWKNYVESAACILALKESIACNDLSKTEAIHVDSARTFSKVRIARTLSASDSKSKVWKDSNGNWHANCGAKITTTLTFNCFTDKKNLVLVDYPAGGVSVLKNESTSQNGEDAKDYLEKEYYINGWYQSLGFDKNEAKAYALSLEPGEYTLSYKSRALCPGRYHMPSAKFTLPNDESEIIISKPDVLIIE